ncbi:MAG: GNAT family N-acetyltransferase [Chitinophagales bacterium]|nr:GNAT family N-acetyltransferase [Chitinophagales bacterium]MDW8428631.1 GNAT family N-acetyltransferase [Chitinophagales bacterium]
MLQLQLPDRLIITHTQAAHAEALEALQRLVFPHLAEEERLHADQYRQHLKVFPEGQFVALADGQVVGGTTTMRYRADLSHITPHRFYEIMGGGWLSTHQPDGNWLYGLDVSVHPEYRQRGIARGFYRVRQYLCRELGLAGQLIVGMLNGYQRYSEMMTVEEYYEKVLKGELFDPTVSVQIKIGFSPVALMKDYLHDATCGNAGVLMVLPAEADL